MTRSRLPLLFGAVFLLILVGLSAGAWWYFFGANKVSAAELVPAETVAFATIPNAAAILEGYPTSQLKLLVDSPNSKPLIDAIHDLIGEKNVDLLNTFLPNLSGQSFIAVTHFDPDQPQKVGLIAAMKPKPGLGNFNAFVEKLKTAWPDVIKQGTTGAGHVAGVDYQWIQGPGAPDKICVAQIGGWIVTAWGETSLQDWVERYEGKASSPSLAQNADYVKSLTRVGQDPMTLVYVNYHAVAEAMEKQMAKTSPEMGAYLAKKLGSIGGAAMGTRFENGEIVDRFSFLMPRQAQLNAGMTAAPCPFETLKFTGPDTRFYWAFGMNWQQYFKNLQEQPGASSSQPAPAYSMTNGLVTALQSWARGAGVDVQKNIIAALGSEVSVQAEWGADTMYPEVGLLVKLDKPEDFKPTITAIIQSVRTMYATSAVVEELNSNNHHFAGLRFVQAAAINPTITEDGDYLGVFLTENQAVRSFGRDESIGLPHNADFTRQVGDKRTGASQILFLDSPKLLDRAYRTAMPYLSLAAMFNKSLAAMLKGKDLPPDLGWLAPMGTWSLVMTPDEDGIQGYSASGVGNQGIFLCATLGGTAGVAQSMGLLPKITVTPGTAAIPGNVAAPAAAPAPTPGAAPDNTTNGTQGTNPPAAPVPDAVTNVAPASTQTPPAIPEATTNSVPAPATNSIPDATSPTPEPAQPH